MHKTKTLKFIYKNWKGETRERVVVPVEIWFGKTEFHRKEQWFLKAFDVEKNPESGGDEHDFALKDIEKFL